MKQFLAIYTGTPERMNAWKALDEKTKKEREQAGMRAWQDWGKTHEKSIISHGAPLGKTKKIDPRGISDIKNQMAAYTIIEAPDHEAAAKLFLNHPHFTIFPGDAVEIMECLPMPEMR